MNISLTSELETYLKDKVATGKYHSTSEVVREALRLLEEQDQLKAMRLASLRQEIQKGVDSLNKNGARPLDMEALKQEARQRWESK